jgi:hypothetical protein
MYVYDNLSLNLQDTQLRWLAYSNTSITTHPTKVVSLQEYEYYKTHN